jgi:hypothetical protein
MCSVKLKSGARSFKHLRLLFFRWRMTMSLQDFKEYLSERSVDFLPTILQYVVAMARPSPPTAFSPSILVFNAHTEPMQQPSSQVLSTLMRMGAISEETKATTA